jgi:hypothetical protein
MMALALLAHLRGAVPFAHRIDELNAVGVRYPQHGRGSQKLCGPRRMGFEEAE